MQLRLSRLAYLFLILLVGTLSTASLNAQSIYGTLTGIVSDPTGAVIADSKLQLRDQQSGSQRDTITNSEGYYTFVSLPPGTYQLTVTANGFDTLKQTGINVLGGDKVNINLTLKVGSTANTVEVTGDVDLLVPVDSGEKSNRLTTKELDNFVQLGTNAAEFIKVMPGFGIANGTNNTANYNGQTVGINGNGGGGNQSPLNGAYSYNGLPGNSLDITADGAHVSDPGCNCATPVNPNSNMISEFKVTMSNFSAENQKGPGVISSVAKSGGQAFHGSGFMSARNGVLNANDWLSNYNRVARPENKYYYPGFTLGGPVLVPKSNFNRKRDKLFFFTGFQYYYQVLDTGLLRATVPTEGMRNGNFSPEELAKLGNITTTGQPPQQINARGLGSFPGGIIPKSVIDPSMQALMNLYQKPNADPNSNGGFNWAENRLFNQNSWQSMTRIDYSISDNTKLYVRYNAQREVQLFPMGLWSAANLNAMPYPTPIKGKNQSDSVTASMTHVFSPTMTNETVFSYTYIAFPNVFDEPNKVDRNQIGYKYKGLFKNGFTQFPNVAANGELASIGTNGGFEVGGARGLYADKFMPTISDTLSKVWGKHTFKAGFFWEHIRNAQPASANTQGQLGFSNGNSNSLGNAYADFLIGNLNSYNETNFNRINDIGYTTIEGFVQDSWKVNKKLTLDLGIRITRFTPWTDNLGFGFSVFDKSKFSTACKSTDYCGFVWNKRDPSVPVSGFPTRAAFYQPRFGMAYDLFGNGKTVLRGGWGRYYYHSGQFTTGLNVSAGVQQINLTNNLGLVNTPWAGTANATPLLASQIDSISVASAALSIQAVDRNNDRNPLTESYSFTVAQRVPWSGLVEVAYVGNQSRYLLNTAGGQGSNINEVPVGAMLSSKNGGVDPATLNANNFRPLAGISDVNLATNNLYSNYNSMQVTYMRSKGGAILSANYTLAKALGILNPTLDVFNLNNTYGVQGGDRRHIANVLYSYDIGRVIKNNKLAAGLINGWQFSGVVQMQSGANLTGNRGQNFGMALNNYKIPGTAYNVSSTSLLGTPNITLMPILTCDPTKNLQPHQFLNNSCYSFPTQVGQNGPTMQPVVYGPAYWNADLGIFKNFAVTEKQKLQFRIDGYNFLNHPLWSFPNNQNLSLGFNGTTGAMNTPLFGYTTTKQGRRIVQLQVKYTF